MGAKRLQDSTHIAQAFRLLFERTDPFGDTFTKIISRVLLLYPTEGYFLSRQQYESLIQLLGEQGETSFILSITRRISRRALGTSHKS